MSDRGKKSASLAVLWILSGVLMAVSIKNMLIDGIYRWMIEDIAFHSMAAEIIILFAVIGAGLVFGRNVWEKVLPAVAAAAVFCWIHVMFLPVLFNLLYLLYICMAGWFFNTQFFPDKRKGILGAFVTGTGAVVSMFCFLSLIGQGSIKKMQLAVLVTGILLVVWVFFRKRDRLAEGFRNMNTWKLELPEAVMFTFVMIMVLIQAGKMNLAIDYDSLWYGLRSPYVLNNGDGIYENLGLLGMVYVYSKGWETLLLPLAVFPSYSFITAGSFWAGVLMLFGVYRLSRCFLAKREALFTTALVSSVPGIMNMMISAKTDIPTLLFQVILLYFMTEYVRNRDLGDLILSGCAFLISWTLKPTALIFSTAVFGMGGIYLLVKRILSLRGPLRQWGAAAMAAAMLIGIWGRSMLLTGVPVNSVFSHALQKMGFSVKYPYREVSLPNTTSEMTWVETVHHIVQRLYGMFVSPTSQEMDHVIFAWGSVLILLSMALMIWAVWLKCRGSLFQAEAKMEEEGKGLKPFFFTIYLPFLLVNMTALCLLGQVDGNYFELFYILTILGAMLCVDCLNSQEIRRKVKYLAIPVLAVNLVLCALSNWAWSLGFTPVELKNPGYYNHREMERLKKAESGNEQIWNILASNPRNHVLAVGNHPQVLAFPCCIQSFNDITGDWGNSDAVLPKTGNTLRFVEYAKLNYIYIQGNYWPSNDKPFEMARYLIRNGKVSEIINENGNLLLCIDNQGEPDSERDEALLDQFEELIVPEFRHQRG